MPRNRVTPGSSPGRRYCLSHSQKRGAPKSACVPRVSGNSSNPFSRKLRSLVSHFTARLMYHCHIFKRKSKGFLYMYYTLSMQTLKCDIKYLLSYSRARNRRYRRLPYSKHVIAKNYHDMKHLPLADKSDMHLGGESGNCVNTDLFRPSPGNRYRPIRAPR